MTREQRRERMEEMMYRELRERHFCRNAVAWLFIGPMLVFLFAAIVGKLTH
ncbi:MAG: hypothetical protein ACJ73N_09380 [Bryobacteraceae bacterium]|jgi:hypothetical protein